MDEKVEENVPVNVEHMENVEQNMEWQIEEKKELTEEEKQQEEERKKEQWRLKTVLEQYTYTGPPIEYFKEEAAYIMQQKEKFLKTIDIKLKRNREQIEAIAKLREGLYEESQKLTRREQKIERKFYNAVVQKRQLQIRSKQQFETLENLKRISTNIINKDMKLHRDIEKIKSDEERTEIVDMLEDEIQLRAGLAQDQITE